MLKVDDLSVAYGGLHALSGVSLTVAEGQFVAIVGPNGAGKTTLFKAISGTVTPVSGRITLSGRRPPGRALLAARPSRHRARARGAAGLRRADGARKPRN